MTEMKSASPGRAKKRWSLADPNIVRLLKMLRPYKKWIIYAVIALAVTAGSSSLIAMLLGKLTDMGFYEHNPYVLLWAPVALPGITVLHVPQQLLAAGGLAVCDGGSQNPDDEERPLLAGVRLSEVFDR